MRSLSKSEKAKAAVSLANRRNAEKSTGPRTREGKARSSRNAFRHGLAIPIDGIPDHSARRDRIVSALITSNEFKDDEAMELANVIVNLGRVRSARLAALVELHARNFPAGQSPENPAPFRNLLSTDRYESEARAKLRRLLRRSFM